MTHYFIMRTWWSRNLPSRYDQVRTVGSLFVTAVPYPTLWREACLHRIGGPAVYCGNDIDTAWCREGRHHRCDGPAMTNSMPYEEWYQEGRHHRIEGPASTFWSAGKWYIEGSIVHAERPWQRRARRLRFLLPCK